MLSFQWLFEDQIIILGTHIIQSSVLLSSGCLFAIYFTHTWVTVFWLSFSMEYFLYVFKEVEIFLLVILVLLEQVI